MKSFILSAAIISLFMLAGCGSKSEWSVIKQMPAPDGGASFFVGFYDQECGISVGEHGLISATSDGGTSWIKGENSSLCRFCLDIVDERTAWCGGNGSHVRVTKDGGKTWQAVTDCKLGQVHRSIDFIDEVSGWVANDFYIASTDDGGATWKKMNLPKLNGKILSLSILSATEGYVLNKAGELLYTSDGGDTWTCSAVEELQKEMAEGEMMSCDFNFYQRERGEIAVSILGAERCKILFMATEDQGATWKTSSIEYPATEVVSEVYFSSNGNYITLTSIKKDMTIYKRDC